MNAPDDVLLITVSIDVQKSWLAILTVGWSFDSEAWILDYEKAEVDPRDLETWRQLAQFLGALRLPHPSGDLPIHVVAIDTGFLTDMVHAAVRLGNAQPGRRGRWFFGSKGVGGLSGAEPLVLGVRDERDAHGHRGPRPIRLNVDEGKHEIMSRLSMTKPGPDFIHIPKRLQSTGLLEELTAEEARPKFAADGAVVGSLWRKKHADSRNEALDCMVMALGLFNFVTRSQWLDLLVKRFGRDAGLARWRARFPGVPIYARREA